MRFQPLKQLVPLALAALTLAFAAGCGQAPTAPIVNQTASPERIQAGAETSGLIGTVVNAVVNLLVKTLKLVGSLGGSLTNGRWRVDVPAGAVDGDATISIGVQGAGASACQLEIAPVSLNHFSTPVTLTVDCSNVPAATLSTYTIFWFDPSAGRWVPVAGSKVDLNAKTVSAPLQHFSQYSVGPRDSKASW